MVEQRLQRLQSGLRELRGEVQRLALKMALIQSALQLSLLTTMSSVSDMPRGLVLRRPYPKESVTRVKVTPTAHFE